MVTLPAQPRNLSNIIKISVSQKSRRRIYLLGTLLLACVNPLAHAADTVNTPHPSEITTQQSAPTIKQIKAPGSSIFTQTQLNQIVAQHINQRMTKKQIIEIAQTLAQHYLANGYLRPNITITQADPTTGSVTFEISEIILSQINIIGLQKLSENYIRDRITLETGKPYNKQNLPESLSLLSNNPLIKRVQPQLIQGNSATTVNLNINIEENSPYTLLISVENHHEPEIKKLQSYVYAKHANLLGKGDTFETEFEVNKEFEEVGVFYSLPISPNETIVRGEYRISHLGLIENLPEDHHADTGATTRKIELLYPLSRTPKESLALKAGLLVKKGQFTDVTFSPYINDINSEASIRDLLLGLEWQKFTAKQYISMKGDLHNGRNTETKGFNPDEIADSYTRLNGKMILATKLSRINAQLNIKSTFQISDRPLLPMAQFTVGGPATARGYPANILVRDNGMAASIELRFPFKPGIKNVKPIFILPFIDYAIAKNHRGSLTTTSTENLASLGIGLAWDPHPTLHLKINLARNLSKVESAEEETKDYGISLLFDYKILY